MLDLTVNGVTRPVTLDPAASLLDALRHELDLHGARAGCGRGQCGACVVMLDGRAVPSCTLTVAEAAGHAIVTIEGLAPGDALHPLQEAFLAEDALQCGACTSGMIMAAAALLAREPNPHDDDIRAALAPHLCRCGVHGRIVRAVARAAAALRSGR